MACERPRALVLFSPDDRHGSNRGFPIKQASLPVRRGSPVIRPSASTTFRQAVSQSDPASQSGITCVASLLYSRMEFYAEEDYETAHPSRRRIGPRLA